MNPCTGGGGRGRVRVWVGGGVKARMGCVFLWCRVGFGKVMSMALVLTPTLTLTPVRRLPSPVA